jgi:hypothetical protein
MRLLVLFAIVSTLVPAAAVADEPLQARFTMARNSDFFLTGATLATDSASDGDSQVDALLASSTVEVTAADIATGAVLQQALVYWSGTVEDYSDCDPSQASTIDDDAVLTAPGGAQQGIAADACYCAGGENPFYDIQACRADVTGLVSGALVGSWTLGGFDARIDNGSTDNASWALLLVYGSPDLPPRRITIYDGVQTMVSQTSTLTLDGLAIDDPPAGDLTWYVLEGDIGGSDDERVSVQGLPGGTSMPLIDAYNPFDNPMNRTINTTTPVQEGVIGVDIDTFDISDALAVGDTEVDVTYTADGDKWWIVVNVVGVNIFSASLLDSTKTGYLFADADGDGELSPGDTVRYNIDLINTGSGDATVDLVDTIPIEADSWTLLDHGGGTDSSTFGELRIDGIPVDAGDTARVTLEIVIAPNVPDETSLINVAQYSAQPDNLVGTLPSDELLVRVDRDGDGYFDNDDNCPTIANEDQADADEDGEGDVCEGMGDDDDSAGDDDAGDDDSAQGDDDDAAGDDDDTGPTVRGCTCDAGAGGGSLLLLLAMAGRRRR